MKFNSENRESAKREELVRAARRGEEGSSLLELALVLPLLLLILAAAVDFGQAYFVGIEVSAAAAAGTSYGITHPTDVVGMQSAATLDASDVPSMVPKATYGCECSDGSNDIAGCVTTPGCGVNAVNYVDVATSVNYKPILLYPGIPSNFVLTGHARMRAAR